MKAPFFGYAYIGSWLEQDLPEHIGGMQDLETYLDEVTATAKRPFIFRLKGLVESATIHIVNLPAGSKVSSPDEAHQGMQYYNLADKETEIIGFFSIEYKAVFTHHDTYLHMHLITADKSQMGHLDEVIFKKGAMKLYLPKE